MGETIAQIDIKNLRSQINAQREPIAERVRACELLLELYPSRRNRTFVNNFIKKNKRPRFGGGAVSDLRNKLLRDRIAKHRERIRQKQKEIALAAKPVEKAPILKPWATLD